MRVLFLPDAWQDYLYWQQNDRKILKRINALIQDTLRSPHSGIGRPEALRHDLSGWWSRRIDEEHRLVYRPVEDGIEIAQCRHHY